MEGQLIGKVALPRYESAPDGPQDAPVKGAVYLQAERLEKSIATLEQLLGALTEKLSPILSDAEPAAEKEIARSGVGVPFARWLSEQVSRAENLGRAVDRLIGRVGL